MDMVGADRDRFGLGDDISLVREQTQRRDNGDDRYANPVFGMSSGFALHQPHDCAVKDRERRQDDHNNLKQRRQCLGLAMAEPVIAVGGLRRHFNPVECDQRGKQIEAGIGKRSKHSDRTRLCRGPQLQQQQERRHRDTGQRGAAGQRRAGMGVRAMVVAAAHG